jgi:hypothetical protein
VEAIRYTDLYSLVCNALLSMNFILNQPRDELNVTISKQYGRLGPLLQKRDAFQNLIEPRIRALDEVCQTVVGRSRSQRER